MISKKHIEEFEGAEKVTLSDAFGSGEVLFARKFSDQGLDLIDRIDRMISQRRPRLEAGLRS